MITPENIRKPKVVIEIDQWHEMVNGLSGNHEEPLNTSLIGNNPYNSSIEKISTAHVIKMIKKKIISENTLNSPPTFKIKAPVGSESI